MNTDKIQKELWVDEKFNIVTTIDKNKIGSSFTNIENYFVSTVKKSNSHFETILKEQGLRGDFFYSIKSESAPNAAEMHLTYVRIATKFPSKHWGKEMEKINSHIPTYGEISYLCAKALPLRGEGMSIAAQRIEDIETGSAQIRKKDFVSLYCRAILAASGLNLEILEEKKGFLSKLFS